MTTYDKIYGEHYVIAYNPRTKFIHTAWGLNIEEEMKKRGLKYWPERNYHIGWIKVYTDEIRFNI